MEEGSKQSVDMTDDKDIVRRPATTVTSSTAKRVYTKLQLASPVAASVTPGGVLTAIAAAPAIRNWVNDEKSAEEDEYERSGLLLRRPMQGPRVIERIDLSS